MHYDLAETGDDAGHLRACMSCSVTKLLNGDLMNGDLMSDGRLSAGHFRFRSLYFYTQKVQFSN